MIQFEAVSFTYPRAETPALANLNLTIPAGEFVLVTGESGSGKSTFLRCINGLVPHFSGGVLSGKIRVGGLDPVRETPKRMSQEVGFVLQDPENQFVMDTVQDDIAFTLENARLAPEEITTRLNRTISQLGIERLRKRKILTLSGGERQKVAIASAIVQSPRLLVLDEPTSQLDPKAAKELLETIVDLKQLGLTVLICEHRLERLLHLSDRLIFFDPTRQGAISGAPDEVLPKMTYHSGLVALGLRLGWEPLPLSTGQAQPFAARFLKQNQGGFPENCAEPKEGEPKSLKSSAEGSERVVLELEGVSVKYGEAQILKDVSLRLYRGEILALMGANGAGKTTLFSAIAGLRKPTSGNFFLDGNEITNLPTAARCRQIGYVPQDPNALLFAETVMEELRVTLRNHRLAVDEVWQERLLAQLQIQDLAGCYPRDLSSGQRQRVALGAILVTKPEVILLDEPTRGMDLVAKQALSTLLENWKSQGKSIMLVTHDVELVARCADRVALLEGGRIIVNGSPRQVLAALGDFSPQIAQVFPKQGWLTEEEVCLQRNRESLK